MVLFVYHSTWARNRLRQRSKQTAWCVSCPSVPEQKLRMDTFRSNLEDTIPSAGRQELRSKARPVSMQRMEMMNKALEYWR